MNSSKVYLLCTIWIALYSFCESLECYVCTNQEDNLEKCTKSIKICEQGEDVCLSEIKWGSTPYWSQGALKQYYISKRCATKAQCQRFRQANMRYCSHIWYEDWACSECCQGDRCNFYIISGSDTITNYNHIMMLIPLLSLLASIQFG